MPTPGYVFKDSGTTPQSEKRDPYDTAPPPPPKDNAPTNLQHKVPDEVLDRSHMMDVSRETDSHALAMADHEVKGAAQEGHDAAEIKNLGWNEPPKKIPQLVGRLPNEELWTLVRRFNKVQWNHVLPTRATKLTDYSKCTMSRPSTKPQ